ncbi:MAG: sirohydrochlorin cobaltochelatase [Deltaproteobacteria bacterium]|nr:sirohydrochlorin cobaltochelatase [Deltaproteobacteria bacterium]
MKRTKLSFFVVLIVFSMIFYGIFFMKEANAMMGQENKKAIVIAAFGTSYPSALKAITNIKKQVEEKFPGINVKVAFTSNIIRNIWHGRQKDKTFLNQYKWIPKEILYVKGPLATIADLQDEGYRTIIVQPAHIYAGEEYTDLNSYINGLNMIKTIKEKYMPFVKLVIGRPALGVPGPIHDYHEDLEAAARAVSNDVAYAKKNRAALVYMGHGNEYYSTGIYIEFQETMRKMYHGVNIYVGTVEGFPSLDDVLTSLKKDKVKKVVLKPFMVVAGDHAHNDMAGSGDDSWKNTFKRAGIRVIPVIKGLGENYKWNEIYIEHIKDAAKDNGIKL